MAFYLSPLVDVNEIDLTTTIPAVATSIGVIVIRDSYKGPEMKQTLVTSENELTEKFGKPIKRTYNHAGTSSVVSNNFEDFFHLLLVQTMLNYPVHIQDNQAMYQQQLYL